MLYPFELRAPISIRSLILSPQKLGGFDHEPKLTPESQCLGDGWTDFAPASVHIAEVLLRDAKFNGKVLGLAAPLPPLHQSDYLILGERLCHCDMHGTPVSGLLSIEKSQPVIFLGSSYGFALVLHKLRLWSFPGGRIQQVDGFPEDLQLWLVIAFLHRVGYLAEELLRRMH